MAVKELTVGELRRATALSPSDERVVLVCADRDQAISLRRFKLVRCYPDTTDADGKWGGTFKIEVAEEV